MKIKFEIKNRFTGKVMFTLEGDSWKIAFGAAVEAGQSFVEADLSFKDFSDMAIDCKRAKFYNATFYNAKFYNAKFYNAKFYNAKFDNATFYNAKFYNATFYNATFDNAKFYNATFDNATFYNATFYNAKFYNATFDNATFDNATFYNATFYNATFDNAKFYNATFDNATFDNAKFYNATFDEASWKSIPQEYLNAVRDDMFAVLLAYPGEIAALRAALVDGKINGSVYSGVCACLFGTIAKAQHCEVNELKGIVRPNSNRPIEVFFYSIQVGNTPKNSRHAKCAVEWIDQFIALAKEAGKVLAK